ncbi:MAG TPA: hypothetical protein VGK40_02305 [Verrucomicrobiae bacterium]|jgi:hypothetical protein
MSNTNKYIDDGARVVAGLTALGTPLNVTHVTKAIFEPFYLDFKAKQLAFEQARQTKTAAFETLRQNRAAADAFLVNIRAYLKAFLGEKWSPLWAPLGFVSGPLTLPQTDFDRCQMLQNVAKYFADHPSHENVAKGYTGGTADELCEPLTDARTAVETCKFDTRSKRDARDAAKAVLDEKISALRSELDSVLQPTDPRWLKFFDRIPGDPRVPEKVEEVTATAQPGGIIDLDWPDTARAARYRVLKQVVGTDTDFVVATTVDDSTAELTGLPAGATVKLQVVPLNGVGSGAASDVIQLQAA